MTDLAQSTDADRALKAAHRAMWSSGNYPIVASDVIAELGPTLAHACRTTKGQKVIDIAAGSGNAAVEAAALGADVVASDLTPELFDAGRRRASERGVDLTWSEADAESLPFDDNSFDTAMSCVGVMFAPHHRVAADEMIRVVGAGGTIGLISWTPAGFIGSMFGVMKPYAAPPPPGAQPPPLWGDEDHVRSLLGDRVRESRYETKTLRVDAFAEPIDFLNFFKKNYGPTIAVYRRIENSSDDVAALDGALLELAARFYDGPSMYWEYLLVTARKV